MSHMWRSHVTHVEESCLTYQVLCSVYLRDTPHEVTRGGNMNESCHTYERVTSHV